jgi:GNAT superfamily N-acetyltransferase
MLVKPIRPAQLQDLPVIVELKLAMLAEVNLSGLLATDAKEIILADYQQLYQEQRALHFVVEDNGIIVAMVGAFLKSDLPFRYYKTPNYGYIGDVYTQPVYRQQGFARQLNEQALTWLAVQGVTTVRLLATKQARPLYEALGFQPSDEMVLRLNRQK